MATQNVIMMVKPVRGAANDTVAEPKGMSLREDGIELRRSTEAVSLGRVLDAAHQALRAGDNARAMIEGFAAYYGIPLTEQLAPGSARLGFDALSLIAMATAQLERLLRDAGFWDALVCATWTGGRQRIAIHPNGEGALPRRYCSSEKEAKDYIDGFLASEDGKLDAERARLQRLISFATVPELAGIARRLEDMLPLATS
jgi:hypothetical protein